MKLKTCALWLFIFIPFVVPWEGATKGPFFVAPPTVGIPATSFLPIADPDFSDLDVRDAQNRPVKSVEAQQNLAGLFMENLFNLTVVAPPHSMQQAIDAVIAFSTLFNRSFFASIPPIFKALVEAIAPSKRRFVHNVGNVWITIFVGVLLSLLLSVNFSLDRSAFRLILRC